MSVIRRVYVRNIFTVFFFLNFRITEYTKPLCTKTFIIRKSILWKTVFTLILYGFLSRCVTESLISRNKNYLKGEKS